MAGVLERAQPPDPEPGPELVESASGDDLDVDASPSKGRGVSARGGRPGKVKAGGKVKPHAFYLPESLFERILVAAHRREKTLSEYVANILDKQVPAYRATRDGDESSV